MSENTTKELVPLEITVETLKAKIHIMILGSKGYLDPRLFQCRLH